MSYYCAEYEVGCHHTDENNHIRPTELVRLLQETANRQMRDRRPSYVEFFRMGKAFVITSLAVEVYGQIRQFDKVEVRTWTCPGKAATFPRCYQIWRGEELVAQASSKWAVPDRFSGKLSLTSEIDISGYEQDKTLSLALPGRVRIPKDLALGQVEEHVVRYSECDMNRHMNNTNYFNLLWDHIPGVTRSEVTSLNIRFMHEAPLGDRIEIFMGECPVDLAGDARAEQVWGFKTTVSEGTNVECLMGLRPAQVEAGGDGGSLEVVRDEPGTKLCAPGKENYTYMLQCGDGSFYTGWTTDLAQRVKMHNMGRGAKYTRAHLPVELVYWEAFATKEEAMRRECAIKKLSRREKEALVVTP